MKGPRQGDREGRWGPGGPWAEMTSSGPRGAGGGGLGRLPYRGQPWSLQQAWGWLCSAPGGRAACQEASRDLQP